jgi:hypothetical protein
LWPRISTPVARAAFEQIGTVGVRDLGSSARTSHPQETFAATGGTRIAKEGVEALCKTTREAAIEYGYPDSAPDARRIAFDRAAAEVMFRGMNITTFEASNRGVWSFLAVVAMPDVTLWRFGRTNVERWIASDLTRHMFARLWWQALTFSFSDSDGNLDFSLLWGLSESDLNQITERRSVAGNARLAQALARAVIDASGARRELIREVTPKLRRRLAFIDFSTLTDAQVEAHVQALVAGE